MGAIPHIKADRHIQKVYRSGAAHCIFRPLNQYFSHSFGLEPFVVVLESNCSHFKYIRMVDRMNTYFLRRSPEKICPRKGVSKRQSIATIRCACGQDLGSYFDTWPSPAGVVVFDSFTPTHRGPKAARGR